MKDAYDNSLLPKEKSKASEAYSLFRIGKNCLDVSIELGLDASETKKYFEEFLDLCGLQELKELYLEIGPVVRDTFTFYTNLKAQGYTIDHIPYLVKLPLMVNDLSADRKCLIMECNELKSYRDGLLNQIDNLRVEKTNLERENQKLIFDNAILGPGMGYTGT